MSTDVCDLPRIETGPVQFEEDWPGLYIRGDNAYAFAGALDTLLHAVTIDESTPIHVRIAHAMTQGLMSDLNNTHVRSKLDGLQKVDRRQS
jgi:hypothetical protein